MPAGLDMLVMIAIFGAAVYFFMIRPQQRRMREHQATIDALGPGARVLLTSGIFATIREIADTQMFVELAPGVEITIVKQAIARVAREDEEEFEITDEGEDLDAEAAELIEEAAAEGEMATDSDGNDSPTTEKN